MFAFFTGIQKYFFIPIVNSNESKFPVLTALQAISDSIQNFPISILDAPPGSGKTTALPLALLKMGIGNGKKICILEPRRIAAKNAAKRISDSIGEDVGQTVGYRVRFDSKTSKNTKIEFVTDGILTKYLLSDPELSEYGLLVFDEFHERRLESDLCFALARKSQEIFRNDLKILIMSATLEGQNFSKIGIHNPPIEVITETFPLEIFYMGESNHNSQKRLLDLIPKAVEQTSGDILVFLSGKKEIIDLKMALESNPICQSQTSIFPLFGDMSLQDQEKVFLPLKDGKKKIVLSTNIAESSVTIPGVRVVFDTGFFKHSVFDPESGIQHLIKDRISLSSAKQRAGRAAREGNGYVYRLWSKEEESSFYDRTKPEILEGDLDRLILEVKSFGEGIDSLPFLDPPNKGSLLLSMERLKRLGCLDGNLNLTPIGKESLLYPLPIRLGRILSSLPKTMEYELEGIVSILENESSGKEAKDFSQRSSSNQTRNSPELKQIYKQILGIFQGKKEGVERVEEGQTQNFQFYLCKGYPDRIAKRKADGSDYKLSNGKIGVLSTNLLNLPDHLIAIDTISFGQTIYITQYLPISLEIINESLGDQLDTVQLPEIRTTQKGESYLVVREERKLGELTLESKELTKPDPLALQNALENYLLSLDWESEWKQRGELQSLYERVRFLVQNQILDLKVSFDELKHSAKEWLFPFINWEINKIALDRIPYYEAFKAYLGYENESILNKEAPTSLLVPSGSKISIHYSGNEPELHVKLQELFGLKQLPRLAKGKVNIVIHLLSPARRPVQITKDLESFWNYGYHEVKKELKGRYPKHPWPDKPWEAVATKHLNHNKRS
ncbi:ATP-dependent helicase HrpB [Leptospira jelokensis]|uniref:ATP-dependent helicase HrpB n=1 Tax=Leptospira jelokensis TaxID=2484931 RepID=UPI001FC93872|nr:ATP-dependent helicase HrpB [Leptospira jelokensis]